MLKQFGKLRIHVAAENNHYDACEQFILAGDKINSKTMAGK